MRVTVYYKNQEAYTPTVYENATEVRIRPDDNLVTVLSDNGKSYIIFDEVLRVEESRRTEGDKKEEPESNDFDNSFSPPSFR